MHFFDILLSVLKVMCSLFLPYIIFKEIIYPKYKNRKYALNLFDKVRWIAIKASYGSIFINDERRTTKKVRDRDLIDYIINEQQNLKIENDYCIDDSNKFEKNFICEILEAHKKEVIENFFCDSLKKEKIFFQLNFFEYYMFSLLNFLNEKLLNRNDFNNIILYNFFRQDGWYKTYKLTEHGFMFLKLLYVVTLFCINNENIKPHITNHNKVLKDLKTELDSKQIKKI